MIPHPVDGHPMDYEEARQYMVTLAGQLARAYIRQARAARDPRRAAELRQLAIEQENIRREWGGQPPIGPGQQARAAAEMQARGRYSGRQLTTDVSSVVTAAPESPPTQGSGAGDSDPPSDTGLDLGAVRAAYQAYWATNATRRNR